MDRFHELNAFIAVVEAGGFSAAARTTGDSQSAISKAIGALGETPGRDAVQQKHTPRDPDGSGAEIL